MIKKLDLFSDARGGEATNLFLLKSLGGGKKGKKKKGTYLMSWGDLYGFDSRSLTEDVGKSSGDRKKSWRIKNS